MGKVVEQLKYPCPPGKKYGPGPNKGPKKFILKIKTGFFRSIFSRTLKYTQGGGGKGTQRGREEKGMGE